MVLISSIKLFEQFLQETFFKSTDYDQDINTTQKIKQQYIVTFYGGYKLLDK